jgi:hypothetical protein
MSPREQELVAREMLDRPELLGVRLKEKRWADVAALVRYVQQDVPKNLAMTDPALYKTLRDQITRFHLRGGGALNLAKLEQLAEACPPSKG